MFRTSIIVAAVAACLAAPALAGGSVSLSINAANSRDAQALRAGLVLYGIVQDIQSNGHVTQRGLGNAAALAQSGGGHLGVIHQDGFGHDGSLTQVGRGNAFGLFQFGRDTSGHVVQTGRGQSGVTIQYGW